MGTACSTFPMSAWLPPSWLETVFTFSQYDGVTVFDQTWAENIWTQDDFYDRNHLDDDGRQKYCELLIPTISEILNGQAI